MSWQLISDHHMELKDGSCLDTYVLDIPKFTKPNIDKDFEVKVVHSSFNNIISTCSSFRSYRSLLEDNYLSFLSSLESGHFKVDRVVQAFPNPFGEIDPVLLDDLREYLIESLDESLLHMMFAHLLLKDARKYL